MALDAEAQAFLKVMEEGFPPVETMTGEEARTATRERRPPLTYEPAVERSEDRTIPGPAGDIPVRIYWPTQPAQPGTPLIVFLHGGGFVICDLDSHDASCRLLTENLGAVVVSVDYRLAPEHPFPAAVDDAYAATVWASENATALSADPARLVVAGDSAGGNLAAVTALLARDRGGPALSGQLLIYPVVAADFDTPSYRDNARGYFLTLEQMRWYWEQYLPGLRGADDVRVSPLRAESLAGLPPAAVVTAEHDPLRDEGEAYAAALDKAGVRVWSGRYPAFHGFFFLPLGVATRARAEFWPAARDLLGITGGGRQV